MNKGEKSGRGKLYFPNGIYIEGTFNGNKLNGRARWIEANGEYYEGEFSEDYKHGQGVYETI